MSLLTRVYSVLVVSASEKFNIVTASLLPESDYSPVFFLTSASSARRLLSERDFDFVIINAPLPEENAERLAIDVASSSKSVVLLLVKNEVHDEVYERVRGHGVFTLEKPVSKPLMNNALRWMAEVRDRISGYEKKEMSIEEKMAEIRLVNRAKWLLIENEKMTEPIAHRYIEKAAMDMCITKKEVARRIIDKFSGD